jgi:hypothetical protein
MKEERERLKKGRDGERISETKRNKYPNKHKRIKRGAERKRRKHLGGENS